MNAGVRSGDYLFGYAQLPSKGEYVLLTGGEKDVLSLASHGFSAFCLNSETSHLPQTLLQGLSDRFDAVGVLYDMDDTGIRQSQKIIEDNPDIPNLFRIELPLSGSKSEKDVSDYFSSGGTATALQDIIMQTIKQQANSMDNLENFIDPKLSEDDIFNLHLTGVWNAYYDNGQISYRQFYKDGLAEGEGASWYPNGQLDGRVTYKAGKREGVGEYFDVNGHLEERSTFKAGKREGVGEYWYENGQLKERSTYKAGEANGLSEIWYRNGQLAVRRFFKADRLEGLYEEWYGNGQLSKRSNFKAGKLDGLYELWDGGGNLLYQTHYKDGQKNGLHLEYDPASGELYHWILFENNFSVKSGKPEELKQLETNKNQTSQIVVPSSPVQEQAQAILDARGGEVKSSQEQEQEAQVNKSSLKI